MDCSVAAPLPATLLAAFVMRHLIALAPLTVGLAASLPSFTAGLPVRVLCTPAFGLLMLHLTQLALTLLQTLALALHLKALLVNLSALMLQLTPFGILLLTLPFPLTMQTLALMLQAVQRAALGFAVLAMPVVQRRGQVPGIETAPRSLHPRCLPPAAVVPAQEQAIVAVIKAWLAGTGIQTQIRLPDPAPARRRRIVAGVAAAQLARIDTVITVMHAVIGGRHSAREIGRAHV